MTEIDKTSSINSRGVSSPSSASSGAADGANINLKVYRENLELLLHDVRGWLSTVNGNILIATKKHSCGRREEVINASSTLEKILGKASSKIARKEGLLEEWEELAKGKNPDEVVKKANEVERSFRELLKEVSYMERVLQDDFSYQNTNFVNAISHLLSTIDRFNSSNGQIDFLGLPNESNIGEIAEDAVASYMEREDVRFTLNLAEGNHYSRIDYDYLIDVLMNLYNNTISAAEESGLGVVDSATTVREVTVDGSSFVEIVVRDNGPGIPSDIQPREKIFNKYESTGGEDSEHKGIGLFNIKSIIEAAGGTISVASESVETTRDSFTEFSIRLPSARTRETYPAEVLATSPVGDKSESPITCLNLLIVDDLADQRSMTAQLLTISARDAVVEVKEAGSYEEAIEIVKEFKPHVVITDKNLAGKETGYDVLEAIRDEETGVTPYGVLITGNDISKEPKHSLVEKKVRKPISIDDINFLVELLEERYRLLIEE